MGKNLSPEDKELLKESVKLLTSVTFRKADLSAEVCKALLEKFPDLRKNKKIEKALKELEQIDQKLGEMSIQKLEKLIERL